MNAKATEKPTPKATSEDAAAPKPLTPEDPIFAPPKKTVTITDRDRDLLRMLNNGERNLVGALGQLGASVGEHEAFRQAYEGMADTVTKIAAAARNAHMNIAVEIAEDSGREVGEASDAA